MLIISTICDNLLQGPMPLVYAQIATDLPASHPIINSGRRLMSETMIRVGYAPGADEEWRLREHLLLLTPAWLIIILPISLDPVEEKGVRSVRKQNK
jgi:hypothetical protein